MANSIIKSNINFESICLNNQNLRDYQIEIKEKIFKQWLSNNSLLLQMPTGTGKTFLFISIVNDILVQYKKLRKEINILLVAHRTELIDQISETLQKYDIAHGFIQGSREQNLWKRVQIGSIMSLLTDKNINNTIKKKYDFIIIDEAHHSLAYTYKTLSDLFPNALKLGVTATPWRFNHESFTKLYDSFIPSKPVSWFIQNNYLSDFDYVSIKSDSEIQRLIDSSEVAITGDFVNADLENTFNTKKIRAKLLESYLKFAKNRKGIIYAINRRHASNIAQLYSCNGINAVVIDCETSKEERAILIEKFKRGEIKVLVNVDIFTEGFDCPDIEFIQLARPTRSLALYLQQVGRGLRISKGKQRAIILDNVGLYNYFGLPDANRKWNHHFMGLPDDQIEDYNKSTTNEDFVIEDGKEWEQKEIEEGNEEMEVVHGTSHTEKIPQADNINVSMPTPKDEEFILGDYYLVSGNYKQFKIYPIKKKRGRLTMELSTPVYEYYFKERHYLTENKRNNEILFSELPKLKTIVEFVCFLRGQNLVSLLDLTLLKNQLKYNLSIQLSIIDFLKYLNQILNINDFQ